MRKTIIILCAAAVLLASLLLLELDRKSVKADDYDLKLKAAELTDRCLKAVREIKEEKGIPINEAADINRTGLIGEDYSFITTTLGELAAKRTSVNPNMAAVVVDMFHELGLKKGDRIAVNCSGSFPALNIAVMCAAEVLELDVIQMSSFGSSTHGANNPELTYPDMEYELLSRGLLFHKSDYVSIGGIEDLGKEMPDEIVKTVLARLEEKGYPLLYHEDLSENINKRYELYTADGEIRCFVNVGGNDVSFGNSKIIVYSDGGILTELPEKDGSTGLVQLFLKNGIPVIHLLNIKKLAGNYGLPVDPVPLPAPGEGGVYWKTSYPKPLAWAGLALSAAILFAFRAVFANEKEPRRKAGSDKIH